MAAAIPRIMDDHNDALVPINREWQLDVIVRPVAGALNHFKQWVSGTYSEDPSDYKLWSRIGTVVAGAGVVAATAWFIIEFFTQAGRARSNRLMRTGSVLSIAGSAASFSYGVSTWCDEKLYRLQALEGAVINAATLFAKGQYEETQRKLGGIQAQLTTWMQEEPVNTQHREEGVALASVILQLNQKAGRLFSYLSNRVVKQSFDDAIAGGLVTQSFPCNDLLELLNGIGEEHLAKMMMVLLTIQKCATYAGEHFFTAEHCSTLQALKALLCEQAERIKELSDKNRLNFKLICLLVLHAEEESILEEVYAQYTIHPDVRPDCFADWMTESIQEFLRAKQGIMNHLNDFQERNRGANENRSLLLFQHAMQREIRQESLRNDQKLLADITEEVARINAYLNPQRKIAGSLTTLFNRECAVMKGEVRSTLPLLSKSQLGILRQEVTEFEGVAAQVRIRIQKTERILEVGNDNTGPDASE